MLATALLIECVAALMLMSWLDLMRDTVPKPMHETVLANSGFYTMVSLHCRGIAMLPAEPYVARKSLAGFEVREASQMPSL